MLTYFIALCGVCQPFSAPRGQNFPRGAFRRRKNGRAGAERAANSISFPENFGGRAVVAAGKTAVKSGHRIESALEYERGKPRVVLPLRPRHEVAHADHIHITVESLPDVAVEQAGKIILIVPEYAGYGVERDRFGIMFVDVVERVHDGAERGSGGGGNAFVMPQKVPHDHVHEPFFYQFRARSASLVRLAERVEIPAQGAVEGAVRQVRGQCLFLEYARKIVRIALPDDEYEVIVFGCGYKFVNGALVREDDVVLFGEKFLAADLAIDGAVRDI